MFVAVLWTQFERQAPAEKNTGMFRFTQIKCNKHANQGDGHKNIDCIETSLSKEQQSTRVMIF